MTKAEHQYRTLLDATVAVADQPAIEAALHSLSGVLSNLSVVYSAEPYLLDGLLASPARREGV